MADDSAAAAYAELHCLTSFSFLRGASQPPELVERAHALGYRALAVTDECSVAGVVRAHVKAKKLGLALLIGAEFRLECGLTLVALAMDRHGYGALCSLITRGRRAAAKGSYRLVRVDLDGALAQCLLIWLPQRRTAGPGGTAPGAAAVDEPAADDVIGTGRWLAARFPQRLWIGVELHCDGTDAQQLAAATTLGGTLAVPLVACGDVHMHVRERRVLQDAMTAIRHRVSIHEAGWRLFPNGERHLRARHRLARLYPPALLAETLRIAERCHFSLDELRYEYPREIVPEGMKPPEYLRQLAFAGAQWRWPGGVPDGIRVRIEQELAIIAELKYEAFFLTVHDVVKEARRLGILCQGRGSAANSVVCFCLGITSVVPDDKTELLFERFMSLERGEPPDIDVDFEHERREEVIQWIYTKYSRERAALAATVISYRPRSALRDVARAFGFDMEQALQLSGTMQWWDRRIDRGRMRDIGFDPDDPRLERVLQVAEELNGFPRHLSQHVGGFVISAGPLAELVPVENATMPERTVIQWDKDDLEDLRLLKVDVLGLGMLTALRRSFDLVADFHGGRHTLATVPQNDAGVYEMICRADTIGVFQVESRAQMSMLPRLKPSCYYDLVIEVAIVRPGPIQGDMVHPYLRRREGKEPVTYPSEAVRKVLERTLGVPIFQEQVMKIAMVAADFTPGEADELRRAMAAWKRKGNLELYEQKLVAGMRAKIGKQGPLYSEEFIQRIVKQIHGFGEYGFPESHAASFALLVYVSAWLKHYHPAAFTAALLNSQPMGFYAPAQLVRDARAHGVELRSVDIHASGPECSLERRDDDQPALRLGFNRVKSLPAAAIARILAARAQRGFTDVQDLGERAGLDRRDLEALAAAGALRGLAGHRHRAYWHVAGFSASLPTAPGHGGEEGLPLLRAPTEGQDIIADYAALGVFTGRHPLALLRDRLTAARIVSAMDLQDIQNGARVRVAGIVTTRQHPDTAGGVTFLTLEDESGQVNILVWERVGDAQRRELVGSKLLEVRGELQHESGITHVIAQRLVDRTRLLGALVPRSRDFH